MASLGRESMEAWYGKLPDDIASCMEKPGAEGQVEADAITSALPSLGGGTAVLEYVSGNDESFVTIGRARRIRFLAWLAARDYPDKVKAIQALTDAESSSGEGGSGGGVQKVAPFFKEDIRALVQALGARAARRIVDADTLAAVTGAGYEVAGELEMRSGGSI